MRYSNSEFRRDLADITGGEPELVALVFVDDVEGQEDSIDLACSIENPLLYCARFITTLHEVHDLVQVWTFGF